ncbi:hypothetical protein RGQ29_031086 [Quercus rubra]|uniref:Uncharacterized protein n=1 Tax=Quercus rubra TaxID=3512 RepID=A0AAN7EJD1_QUERU|nr:hypothetical protein RGQ29_031086 [Quercus rubra]
MKLKPQKPWDLLYTRKKKIHRQTLYGFQLEATAMVGLGLLGSETEMMGLESKKGRSWASSISSSSRSVVPRLIQEQRSSEAKKAEATLEPTKLAARSIFSHDMKLQFFSIVGSFLRFFDDFVFRERG